MAIVALDPNSVRTSPNDWQAQVKAAIRDPNLLRERLGLPLDHQSQTVAADQTFSTFVPEAFLARMKHGDPDDPLLKQVLPTAAEQDILPGFSIDAVGDADAKRAAGLIHKYHGRVLLITRGVCAVHCRYCFRRHFPYEQAPVSIAQFDEALEVVRADKTIEEVILSGGDPLMMVDAKLKQLIELIEEIPHVERLRIHTRLPIVIPARITEALQSMLLQSRLTKFVVVHANHPREIDVDVVDAFRKIVASCSTLLNQSVLLQGVNDDAATLIELSRRLVNGNCMPYYLHQLDRVQGAAHFEVDEQIGKNLIEEMQKALPGYAVPMYVREIPGEASKTPLLS